MGCNNEGFCRNACALTPDCKYGIFKEMNQDTTIPGAAGHHEPFTKALTPPKATLAPQKGQTRSATDLSLTEDALGRTSFPMVGGLLDYFPNALAMVSQLSHVATQQHHPDDEMHWDRSKSKEHSDKIVRHLIDRHTVDDKGQDHWAMVCWRALAGYQEYLEAKHGLPPSRASRNRPEEFGRA